jgi:hypothetical protein
MTQAFNLAQLANNLNTSGQLDATDGLAGVVPIANGGTGSSATAYCNINTNTSGVLSIAKGGTNATTAAQALANLGGLQGSSVQLAKAWINVNGMPGQVGTRGVYNISSYNFFSTGQWSFSFTVPMANANYVVTTGIGLGISDDVQGGARIGNLSSSSFELGIVNARGLVFTDNAQITCVVFGA